MKTVATLMVGMLLLIELSACASAQPTQEQLASANYGASISQEEAQRLATAFFSRYLPDPLSTRYEWKNIHKGWMGKSLKEGGGLEFGYMMDVDVNTKNKFGGYTGFKTYAFLFRDGFIEAVYTEMENSGIKYVGKIFKR